MLQLKVIEESSLKPALLGLGLSYGLTQDIAYAELSGMGDLKTLYAQLIRITQKLCNKDTGENKFLEHIAVWLDIDAPRYWWQQMDTYRVGISKQSESTMHTLTKRPLTQADFAVPIETVILDRINKLINARDWRAVKANLPEAFLQRRVVATNYKVLRHIVAQRAEHRLPEWQDFCNQLRVGLSYPEFINWQSRD